MPVSNRTRLATNVVLVMSGGLREPREAHTIDGVREELREGYHSVPDNGNVLHVDTSPTGAGKSTAAIVMVKRLIKEGKIVVYLTPTHQNCQETVARFHEAGIPSAAYPRLDEESCQRYEEVSNDIIALGLSVPAVICPKCFCRKECKYVEETAIAREASVQVATHARGLVSLPMLINGVPGRANKCGGLIVDEDPRHLLRPKYALPNHIYKEGQQPNIELEHPLQVVARIAKQAEAMAADPLDRGFYRHLASVAGYLDREHHAAFETCEVELPGASLHTPPELHRDLWRALCELSPNPPHRPPREAVELAVLAALGKLSLIVVVKNEYLDKGGTDKSRYVLTGVGRVDLPIGLPTVAISYTMDLDGLAGMTSRPLHSLTPRGADSIPWVHPVTQITRYDVTKGWKLHHAADVLRGILYDISHRRVGLLTHKNLCDAGLRDALGDPFAERVCMVSHFGDGLSRGSNEWLTGCDALVILGPPRPGTPSIREWLVWMGYKQAAGLTEEQAGWGEVTWTGTTASGKPMTVTTKRYQNSFWHRAYTDICKMQLIQAIGRGRGILPSGIPVFIVTTEDICNDQRMRLGTGRHILADPEQTPYSTLNLGEFEVLQALEGSTNLEPLKIAKVVRRLGLLPTDAVFKRVKRLLEGLKGDGRVRFQRAGQGRRRGRARTKGWFLAPAAPAADGPADNSLLARGSETDTFA